MHLFQSAIPAYMFYVVSWIPSIPIVAQDSKCMASLQAIADKGGAQVDAKPFIKAICDSHPEGTPCWVSILGFASAFADNKIKQKPSDYTDKGCKATTSACQSNVATVLTTVNETAGNDGSCPCHFFNALCNANFPDKTCDVDIVRLIRDYGGHKIPKSGRRKRDLWAPQCRSGNRVWPILDESLKKEWTTGNNLWKAWESSDDDGDTTPVVETTTAGTQNVQERKLTASEVETSKGDEKSTTVHDEIGDIVIMERKGGGTTATQSPKPNTTTRPITTEPTEPPKNARPKSSDVRCGRPKVESALSVRIWNGTEAKRNSWPWQISIRWAKLGWQHICGGSIISDRHILTAAHCVEQDKTPSDYQVVLGLHERRGEGTVVVASAIYVNPKRNVTARNYDAAIIALDQPIQFSDSILPVCLPRTDVKPGSAEANCVATGWGRTEDGRLSEKLMEVRLPIIDNATCRDRNHYGNRRHFAVIDDSMICASAPMKDTCEADSGGPYVCQRPSGTWEIQGLTSFGPSMCAAVDQPGVYTRILAVIQWIDDIMKTT